MTVRPLPRLVCPLIAMFVIVLTAASGCCGQSAPDFAIEVRAVDARTGVAPSTAILMVVRDGAYTDTARVGPPWQTSYAIIPAALARAGTYSIEIISTGYLKWERSGVEAHGDRCSDVETRRIEARLEPVTGT